MKRMYDKDKIRKLVIIGIFSDDLILNDFSLKGGNALSIAYDINNRASMDIDISMKGDLKDINITKIQLEKLLENNIRNVLITENFDLIDFKLIDSPKKTDKPNWGGYRVSFKVIDLSISNMFGGDIEKIRKTSIALGKGNKKDMTIDISKYEYIDQSIIIEINDTLVSSYSLLMIVAEKLRAICQQMPEYKEIMSIKTSPRPRDFYDIFTIFNYKKELFDEILLKENKDIIKKMFKIKNVPLNLIDKIKLTETKEFHERAFGSVEQSIGKDAHNKGFSFYYDFVCELIEKINLDA